jgi:hypothetical protein
LFINIVIYDFDILFIGQKAENAAAICYGDSSDCLDSGRISGDAAKPRIRTDASRPFSLPQPRQKNSPHEGADFW